MTGTRICVFIRVSTHLQDYGRQHAELMEWCSAKGYLVTKVVAGTVSGTKRNAERVDITELKASAFRGEFDKVLVTEISRLGRNADQIRAVIRFLHELKIPVIFKNLGCIESLDEKGEEAFVSNLIIAIHAEQAQEEKRLLRERIVSGLANAARKGKQIGRPAGVETAEDTLSKYPSLTKDIAAGISVRKCMKIHSVSMTTIVKVKRLMRERDVATAC